MIGRSAIGVQISDAKRTSFGRWLDACHATGAPVACVFSVDQDVAAEVKQRSPRTVTFFRSQKSPLGADNPEGVLTNPDIEGVAEAWMASLLPHYANNHGFDYAVPNNEWDIGDLEAGEKINRFQLRCMQIVDRWDLGYLAGALSFSTGCPSDDPLPDKTPLTLEQRLATILPAIQYACEHGHVLVFHVHGADLVNSGEHVALRIHRILRYLADASQHPEFGSLLPLCAFGEFSNGVEGIEPTYAKWLHAVKWFDNEMRNSPWRDQIIGFALYGYTDAATIAPAIDDLINWMTGLPELPMIDPIDPPPPPDPIRTYHRVYHLLPKSAPYARRIEVDFEADPRGETVGRSIDDAFVTSAHLLSRTVYVWNMAAFAEFNFSPAVLEAWVAATYPGPIEIVYREFAGSSPADRSPAA